VRRANNRKQNDRRASMGVIRITKNIDFNGAFLEVNKNSDSGSVITKSFLEVIQPSTESIIYKDKC
tara:strand:- start:2851 stop:3048 length:198 start_codon:yes stop_codon:yes gene_type:complete